MYSPTNQSGDHLVNNDDASLKPNQSVIERERAPIQFHTDKKANMSDNDLSNSAYHQSTSAASAGGWGIDTPTKIFSVSMLVITIVLTILFSIMAEKQANNDDDNNGGNNNNLPKDQCFALRGYTMWRKFPSFSSNSARAKKCESMGLTRGKTFPCSSDIECQLAIPSFCLYGDSKFLVCDNVTSVCAVETASLPVSVSRPNAGRCPPSTKTFVSDCGDLIGNINKNPIITNTETLSMNPVICATSEYCDDKTRFPNIACQKFTVKNETI